MRKLKGKERAFAKQLYRIFSCEGLRKVCSTLMLAFVIFFSMVYINTGYVVVLPPEAFSGVVAAMGLFSFLLLAVYHLHAWVSRLLQRQALQALPAEAGSLLENAVKHNAFSKRSPLRIVIGAEGRRLVVRNNRRARLQYAPSSGYGLSSIRERYHSLCGEGIEIEQNPKSFALKLPLLKQTEHEDTDHRG